VGSKRNLIKSFQEVFHPANVKHLLLNYSEKEIGRRHPELPEGIIFRDQFQTDVYCGQSRIILSGEGLITNLAPHINNYGDYYTIHVSDIKNFKLLDKHFCPQVFDGRKGAFLKNPEQLSYQSIIGPQTYVLNADGTTGKIMGAVSLNNVIDAYSIFDEESTELPSTDVQLYHHYKQAFGF